MAAATIHVDVVSAEESIFSGEAEEASDDNLVTGNLITNSKLRYDVEYWWSGSGLVGTGNVLSSNCVWGGTRGTIMQPVLGFTSIGNVIADPLYAVRSGATYRLASGSPWDCPWSERATTW